MDANESKLPKRKNIRLFGYDYSRDGMYYITICADKRQMLFGDIVGEGEEKCVMPNSAGKMIEKWLFKLEDKYEYAQIGKYVIMHDHIHFILSIVSSSEVRYNNISINDMIRWFKAQTTNEYIKKVKSGEFQAFDGKVWQRNYYEHIIRNEQSFQEIWQYIDNNPAKWQEYHDIIK